MYPTGAINDTISKRLMTTLMRAVISLLCTSTLLIQVEAQANNSMIPPVFEVFENSSQAIANSRNISCMVYQPSGDCGKLLPKYDHIVEFAVNTTHRDNISDYEKPFVDLHRLLMSRGLDIHQRCLDALFSFLCNFIFPTCDPAFSIPVQQSVCQQSCETLSVFVCPEKFTLALDLVTLINPMLKCDGVMNGGDAPDCVDAVNKGEVPQFSLATNCFTGRGRGYNGTINMTRSGKTCQRWSEQAPHQFILPSSQYPEIAGDHNYCRNPGSRAPDGPWCFTTDPNSRWEYCDVPKCEASSSCQLYYNTTDAVCFGYGSIGYDYVFINNCEGGSIKELNNKLKRFRDALYDSSEPHPPECIDIILGLMCHHTFPLCDHNSTTPVPRKVCRSYCEEVSSGRCRDFWNKFMTTSDFLIIQLPDCHTLPSPEGGDHLECFIPYNYGRNRTDNNLAVGCYTENNLGINYNGTLNVTESGRFCQQWDSDTPHFHPLTSLFRPYLEGHNYCRNPEGRGKRPWCYTMDPAVRWEYCKVPQCPVESDDVASGGRNNPVMLGIVIAISLLVIVLLILVVVICCLCVIKEREQQANFLYTLSKSSNDNNYEETLCNSNYVRLPSVMGIDQLPIIPRENITHISELGQGNFGMVIKGEARDVVSDQSSTLVAIKFLKEGSNTDARQDFVHEAVVVNKFDHPNILKLLGVCFDQEPYFITFEYMEFGDLNKYLRNKAIGVNQPSSSLTVQQSVDMAINIAAGLEYLAEHHFVHRDLATRNCLINEQLLVKIADFGLSKDVYSRDYYRLEERSLLPIRWMPPEAILYCKFSTQSDVWSFGVVLWEIFAGGVQPYYTRSNDEVVEFVTNKGMLMCPAGCPRSLYKLMVDCWAAVAESRPTASEIYTKLCDWNPIDDIVIPQSLTQTVELILHGDGSSQLNKETIV